MASRSMTPFSHRLLDALENVVGPDIRVFREEVLGDPTRESEWLADAENYGAALRADYQEAYDSATGGGRYDTSLSDPMGWESERDAEAAARDFLKSWVYMPAAKRRVTFS